MSTPMAELRGISKYFEKVIANKDVSFTIGAGEVLALLGENGAGKSTIMKILYGLYRADEGQIFIRGKATRIASPRDAQAAKIAMIQQHFSLVPVHTVTENIILGHVKGRIDLKKQNAIIREIAERYGFDIPVDRPVGELSVGQQQKVEILKALYLDAKLLIMDEPTAVLTPQEADTLMGFIRAYVEKGNSVVFITHKMKEVMAVADHIVIMRNGVVSGDIDHEALAAGLDEASVARMMMGRELMPAKREGEAQAQDVCLSLKAICMADRNGIPLLKHVDLAVHHGEVLGIAGVSGNGQDDLCEVICGVAKPDSGEVLFEGRDITKASIRERIEAGMGYVPVDRYRDGMVMAMTLSENMLLKHSFDPAWRKGLLIDRAKLGRYTAGKLEEFKVKATGGNDTARRLSGGNQQKVVLARETDIGTQMIVFNQPTRGLDMGASNKIHTTILEERANGKAVMLVSTELSEIFALSDRIAVMYQGECIAVFKNGEHTVEEIGLMMAGVKGGRA